MFAAIIGLLSWYLFFLPPPLEQGKALLVPAEIPAFLAKLGTITIVTVVSSNSC